MNKKTLAVTCLLLLAPHAHGMLRVSGLVAQRMPQSALVRLVSSAKPDKKNLLSMRDVVDRSRSQRDQLVADGRAVAPEVVPCPIADGRAQATIDDCCLDEEISHYSLFHGSPSFTTLKEAVVYCKTCQTSQASLLD